MVRSKADVKALGGKSTRKTPSAPVSESSKTGGGASKGNAFSTGGGNAYNPQPTPQWQKEITMFFISKPKNDEVKVLDKTKEDSGSQSSHQQNGEGCSTSSQEIAPIE